MKNQKNLNDELLQNFTEFEIANEQLMGIVGGTSCVVYGTRVDGRKTWMDIARIGSDGEILEIMCEQPDSEWGGFSKLGTQIC